jgi:hypothetical protein
LAVSFADRKVAMVLELVDAAAVVVVVRGEDGDGARLRS